jgi:hypothetical protein
MSPSKAEARNETMPFEDGITGILDLIKSLGIPNEEPSPAEPDDRGASDSCHDPGEALAKFDFSHNEFNPHAPDHSGDIQAALASMSADDALEYAIAQMGPADHLDAGPLDVSTDSSHHTDT